MDTQIIDVCRKLAEAGQWDELKEQLTKHFSDLTGPSQASVDNIIDVIVAQAQLDNAISVPMLERVEYLYAQLAELDKADTAIDEAVAKHEVRKTLSQD